MKQPQQISFYHDGELSFGYACWKNGALLEVGERVQLPNSHVAPHLKVESFVAQAIDKYGKIKLVAMEKVKDKGTIGRAIEEVMVAYCPQNLKVETFPEIYDRAIELLKSFPNKSPLMVGAAGIGISAGFGTKIDSQKSIDVYMSTLQDNQVCVDPGVLQQISEITVNFYNTAVGSGTITAEDCVKIRAITLFAELIELPEAMKAKIRRFGEGIERMHTRLQADKRIEMSLSQQVQEDVKEIMRKLDEYESKGGVK